MISTPVGHQRSPCLSNSRIVLFASVLKYSPSSTCVPSDSSTSDTFSFCGTPSFSLPSSRNTGIRSWNGFSPREVTDRGKDEERVAEEPDDLRAGSTKTPTNDPKNHGGSVSGWSSSARPLERLVNNAGPSGDGNRGQPDRSIT